MNQKILDRFEELIAESKSILAKKLPGNSTARNRQSAFERFDEETQQKYNEWKVKAENILKLVCGENSVHYENFLFEKNNGLSLPSRLANSIPVLVAAYDDLKCGFLISIKQIIQADVFESELEQAQHFLDSGYKVASAVTAGVVLETAIKELCKKHGIDIYSPNSTTPKRLDMLNADLKKSEVYNALQQKQITTLAHIRNKAAHGEIGEFDDSDVQKMIRDIESFLISYNS